MENRGEVEKNTLEIEISIQEDIEVNVEEDEKNRGREFLQGKIKGKIEELVRRIRENKN